MANNGPISLDVSYAIKDQAIAKYQDIIGDINKKIKTGNIEGKEKFGFFDVFKGVTKHDYNAIKQKSKELIASGEVEVLVVIASKEITLQSQALIEFSKGLRPQSSSLEIIFVNDNINGRDIAQLCIYLSKKNFAINVISQRGDSIETLLLFREFRSILEKKLGKVNANKYIYVSTNNNYGTLFEEVRNGNYEHFVIYDNTIERYFSFSAGVLFVLACAAINIDKFLDGANKAAAIYSKDDLEVNVAYRYAVARTILFKNEHNLEFINVFSKSDYKLGELWKMYFSEASVKNHKGILPLVNFMQDDAKVFGQSITQSGLKIFETSLYVNNGLDYKPVSPSADEANNYNYLNQTVTYNKIGKAIADTIIENHVIIYKIPNLRIFIADDSDITLGWMMVFLHRASIVSAYLLGLNPFVNTGQANLNMTLLKSIKDISGGNNND
ncbi:Glucose-6-phosphate isomerase [Metamycoplasma arthritidis]|uniref:glucose-6-phosphate isomerase n=1 Tax=Metamycoplasma arthritidis TaxID=2111 RepID=UPI00100507BB|nr:glucose-6-phosphate isomerase [Metamycoplasma arthritidis]VEU78578.1 Glucose-6-phosphate isomerase [Metamycoplasma arthritidis]